MFYLKVKNDCENLKCISFYPHTFSTPVSFFLLSHRLTVWRGSVVITFIIFSWQLLGLLLDPPNTLAFYPSLDQTHNHFF